MSAAFSAIMMTGDAVLPDVIRGMTEASTTLSPFEPVHAQVRVHHGVRVLAHFARPRRVEDRRRDVADLLHQVVVGANLRAGQQLRRRVGLQRLRRHDAADLVHGLDRDAAVVRRGQR